MYRLQPLEAPQQYHAADTPEIFMQVQRKANSAETSGLNSGVAKARILGAPRSPNASNQLPTATISISWCVKGVLCCGVWSKATSLWEAGCLAPHDLSRAWSGPVLPAPDPPKRRRTRWPRATPFSAQEMSPVESLRCARAGGGGHVYSNARALCALHYSKGRTRCNNNNAP